MLTLGFRQLDTVPTVPVPLGGAGLHTNDALREAEGGRSTTDSTGARNAAGWGKPPPWTWTWQQLPDVVDAHGVTIGESTPTMSPVSLSVCLEHTSCKWPAILSMTRVPAVTVRLGLGWGKPPPWAW